MATELLELGSRGYIVEEDDSNHLVFKDPDNGAFLKYDKDNDKIDSLATIKSLPADNLITTDRDPKIVVKKDSGGTWHAIGETTEVDSGSDAATVIQSALDDVAGGNFFDKVLVKGDATISTRLSLGDWTHLEVLGRLTLADSTNDSMFDNADASNAHIIIEGGRFDGNEANQTAGSCINMQNTTDVRVVGGYFETFYHYCFQFGNVVDTDATNACSDIKIVGATFDDPSGDDCLTFATETHDCIVEWCIFKNADSGGGDEGGNSAFEPEDGAHDITFANNIVHDWSGDAVFLHKHTGNNPCEEIYIENCVFDAVEKTVATQDITGLYISNCSMDGTTTTVGDAAVLIEGGTDIHIDGGGIKGAGKHGIRVNQSQGAVDDVYIEGVTVKSAGDTGIVFASDFAGYAEVNHCTVENQDADATAGLTINGGTVRVNGGRYDNNPNAGIRINGGTARLDGGQSNDNGGRGVDVRAAGARITDWDSKHTGDNRTQDYAIHVDGDFDDIRISDCDLKGDFVVIRAQMENSLIEGCFIEGVGGNERGIWLDNAGENADDNIVRDCKFASTSPDIEVDGTDNRLEGVPTDDITDNGTRTRINGMGEEASSGSPTAANWDVGDVVEDTNNAGDLYIKVKDGTFEQIST